MALFVAIECSNGLLHAGMAVFKKCIYNAKLKPLYPPVLLETDQNATIQTCNIKKTKHVLMHTFLFLQWKWLWGWLEYTGIGVRVVLCSVVCWVCIELKFTCVTQVYFFFYNSLSLILYHHFHVEACSLGRPSEATSHKHWTLNGVQEFRAHLPFSL